MSAFYVFLSLYCVSEDNDPLGRNVAGFPEIKTYARIYINCTVNNNSMSTEVFEKLERV